MSIAGLPDKYNGVKRKYTTTLVACWGGAEQQARAFAALRTCLADSSLLPLPADVRTSVGPVTWALVADIMRLAESPQWCDGLPVPKSAMGHQMLWL